MPPRVSVLQLDTNFPRIAGDVGCKDSYMGDVELLRITDVSVRKIVNDTPEEIDIAPFEQALAHAKGDVVVTSCGFLSFWQTHLEKQTNKPFISSSLIALEYLSQQYAPGEILILTFDENALTSKHLGAFADYCTGIVGLPKQMHLRKVISENLVDLDVDRATSELSQFIAGQQRPQHKHLLLECTNLPPYKTQIRSMTSLSITDILTLIEDQSVGSINPRFL